MKPTATVMITTRNRCEMLRRAVKSAVMQEGNVEVLVVDDASTDGTVAMLKSEFPSVRVEARTQQEGYIVQRNLAVRLAEGPIVITIDDDAVFETPHVVAQAVACFDHPRIGALAITFVNHFGEEIRPWFKERPTEPSATATYVGTASAVRRDLFLEMGGYRELYHHWGEEADFCLRLLDRGYVVRLAVTDLIHHYPSHTLRNFRLNALVHRNRLLGAWFNSPWVYVLPLMAATTAKGLLHGVKTRDLSTVFRGLGMGYRDLFRYWGNRRPVKLSTAHLFRELSRKTIPLTELESRLSPLSDRSPSASSVH